MLERLIDAARLDLATRIGANREEIAVASALPVNWPDSSLGCPVEGKMYAQVVTPGYRILLTHRGAAYEYHADSRDRVVSQSGASKPGSTG